jgi:hypothetical protein
MDTSPKKCLQKNSHTLGKVRLCSYSAVCEGPRAAITLRNENAVCFFFTMPSPRVNIRRFKRELPCPPNVVYENRMILVQFLNRKRTLSKSFHRKTSSSVTAKRIKIGENGRLHKKLRRYSIYRSRAQVARLADDPVAHTSRGEI